MYYKNYSLNAVIELEKQRTGNYGEDYEKEFSDIQCEECGTHSGRFFDINSHIYCSECILDLLRTEFEKAGNIMSEKIDAGDVLQDIISDFSDNEILCYVENKYPEI